MEWLPYEEMARIENKLLRPGDKITIYVPAEREYDFVRRGGLERLVQLIPGVDARANIIAHVSSDIPDLVGESESSDFVFGVMDEVARVNPEIKIENLDLTDGGIYKGFVFGLPALCVMGKDGLSPNEYVGRYGRISRRDVPSKKGRTLVSYQNPYAFVVDYSRLDDLMAGKSWSSDFVQNKREALELFYKQNKDFLLGIVTTGDSWTVSRLGVVKLIQRYDGMLLGTDSARELWYEAKALVRSG